MEGYVFHQCFVSFVCVLVLQLVPEVQSQPSYLSPNPLYDKNGVSRRAGTGGGGRGYSPPGPTGNLGSASALTPPKRHTLLSSGSTTNRVLASPQQTAPVSTIQSLAASTSSPSSSPSQGTSQTGFSFKLSDTEIQQMQQLVRFLSKSEAQRMRDLYAQVGNSQEFRDRYNANVQQIRRRYLLIGGAGPHLPLWPRLTVGGAIPTRGLTNGNSGQSSTRGVVSSPGGGLGSTGSAVTRTESMVSDQRGVVTSQRGVVSSQGGVTSDNGGVFSTVQTPTNSQPRMQSRPSITRTLPRQPLQATPIRSNLGSMSQLNLRALIPRTPTLTSTKAWTGEEPWRVNARLLPITEQRRLKRVYDIIGDTPSFQVMLRKAFVKFLPGQPASSHQGAVPVSRANGIQQTQSSQQPRTPPKNQLATSETRPPQQQLSPTQQQLKQQQLQLRQQQQQLRQQQQQLQQHQQQLRRQQEQTQHALTGLVVASSLNNRYIDDDKPGSNLNPLLAATYVASNVLANQQKYAQGQPSTTSVISGDQPGALPVRIAQQALGNPGVQTSSLPVENTQQGSVNPRVQSGVLPVRNTQQASVAGATRFQQVLVNHQAPQTVSNTRFPVHTGPTSSLESNFPHEPSPPKTTTTTTTTTMAPLPLLCPANHAVRCKPVRKTARMAALCEYKCDVITAVCDVSAAVCRCSCEATEAQQSLQLSLK